jgi:hypothetical protein
MADTDTETYATDSATPRDEYALRDLRLDRDSGSAAMNGIVGVAMVGLLGGSPRLAIRAARVMLEDSYGSRSASGPGRLRGRIRRRGE